MDIDFVREKVTDLQNSIDKLYTNVMPKRILIGTHHYVPTEKVYFTSKGIRIFAPNVKNANEMVILDIQTNEVVKIVSHMQNPKCVFFIYTLNSCGAYVRESLDMTSIHDNTTPYFNPTAKTDYYKRIVLIIDTIQEEAKSVIRSIYPPSVIEEISQRDSSEMLERCWVKDAGKRTTRQDANTLVKDESGENIRQILIYPQGKGGISINTEDYMCLAIDQYLNDVIIDFYLKYLLTELLTDNERNRTHVFSTFFYKRLTTMTTNRRNNDKDPKMSASQKRHARVKNWTKSVNLFEKDFIIIPINEQSHWFLAIICFPSLKGPQTFDGGVPVKQLPAAKKVARKVSASLQIGNTTITPVAKREYEAICLGDESERDEAEGDESDLASDMDSDAEAAASAEDVQPPKTVPVKQPCILIFDSLAGASRSRVVATLRDYLTCEYRLKNSDAQPHTFTKDTIPGHSVKVPQQNNFTDCGLYLLQYVEQFYRDPVKDFHIPIKNLTNWFDPLVVTRKREEISMLLKELVQKYNADQLPLPDVLFPTLNGKLVERESTFSEDGEFEEEELDEEMDGDEESDDAVAGTVTEPDSSPEKQTTKIVKTLLPIFSTSTNTSAASATNNNSNSSSNCNSPTTSTTTISTNTSGGGCEGSKEQRKLFKRQLDDRHLVDHSAAKRNARFDALKNN